MESGRTPSAMKPSGSGTPASTLPSQSRNSLQGIDSLHVLIGTSSHSITSNNSSNCTPSCASEEHVLKPFEIDPSDFVACYYSTVKPCKEIFPFSSLPYADLRPSSCKYTKSRCCLLKQWNLKEKKNRDIFKSSSTCQPQEDIVYPIPKNKMKNKTCTLADTKLVICSNPKCYKTNEHGESEPTVFHYCCYANNIEKDDSMKELVYDEDLDTLTESQLDKIEKISPEKVHNTNITLPVCGKSCYNAIVKSRKNKVEMMKKQAMAQDTNTTSRNIPNQHKRWDCDGTENSLSSEEVIINWLTTNENAEMYFGGNHGTKNSVNGVTKDTYHVRISNLIHKENGTYKK